MRARRWCVSPSHSSRRFGTRPVPFWVRGLSGVNTKEIRLDKGSHKTYEEGHCLLEVAAHLAGEPHTDTPACVCPVLAAAGRGLNDALGDKRRQALLGGLAPALVGTRDPSKEHQRSVEWLDWLVRTYLLTWLDLVPALAEHAAAVRGLPAVSEEDARVAGVLVKAAAVAAGSLKSAARVAVKNTQVFKHYEIVVDLASEAAWSAAWPAAVDAWWSSTWNVVGWGGVLDAVRDAAWDAAQVAAWDAASQLAPTVEALQDSAAALLRRQCGL